MTAFAAVYSPNQPAETGINVYFNTANAQLAVTLKSSVDDNDPSGKEFAASENDYEGYIMNPSELAVGSFRGFDIVVAVTKPKSEGRPVNNQISVVSPVYMGIGKNTLQHLKVAVAASTANAWVYFLDGPDREVRLKEFNYTTQGTTSYREAEDIMVNSSLAAWYNEETGHRCVIYQDYNQKRLKEFNLSTKDTNGIVSTDEAKEGTSIALSFVQGKVYLYYTDKLDNLQRVTKSGSTWSTSMIVRDSPPVGTSQIAIATANNCNHIFYIQRDDSRKAATGFTHVIDRLQ